MIKIYLYLGYFSGIVGLVIGSFYGYIDAYCDVAKLNDELKKTQAKNIYATIIIKNIIYYSISSFYMGIFVSFFLSILPFCMIPLFIYYKILKNHK